MMHSVDNNEWELNVGRRYDASALRGRVLEYTDNDIKARFSLPDGTDFKALMRFPCLFTYEGKDVTGAIGWINQVVPRDRGLEITYSLPTAYPKLRMNDDDIFSSLGIDFRGYEWSRTHWAVKDIDLFEVTTTLLHNSDQHLGVLSGPEMRRIWGEQHEQGKLAFLSHRSNYRGHVAAAKEVLESQGLSCFLAHEDVMASLEWQSEITNALNTMDIFVGFVTEDFHAGGWTDQEIGYAHKRGVHRVFVKLGGANPVGMVAREQALSANWENAADRILAHLRSVGLL